MTFSIVNNIQGPPFSQALYYSPNFPSGVRLKLFARAIAGSLGIICQFHGLRYLPLADVNMIAAASPIFTVFFAWIYIRERAGTADFVNLLLVFAGKVLHTSLAKKPLSWLRELASFHRGYHAT